MPREITKNKRDQWNDILKQIRDFFTSETEQIAQVAYQKGATYQDLADATGTSKQNIQQKYPRKEGDK